MEGGLSMKAIQTRRRFLTAMSLAGAAGLVRAPHVRAEATLETTSVRFTKIPATCLAPQYAAEELLRAEGFTEVRYVDLVIGTAVEEALARGNVDFNMGFVPAYVAAIDAGDPITVLSGIHAGCIEAFGNESVRSITDLKGKRVGVLGNGGSEKHLVAVMAAYVGLDPGKDIIWVSDPARPPIELFAEGKIDAFLSIPPFSLDLRARHIGHSFVNSAADRPWSQYFCCMLAANQDFVRNYPNATKRVLRAVLKTADLCATDPNRIARQLVDGGFTDRYDYARQTLNEAPYQWRDFDPEDSLRFYALRLRETGFIKSSPQKIIADGTDWRFLNELKRELKA
jgi:NitT/TauT family transport system substrate-binding protein